MLKNTGQSYAMLCNALQLIAACCFLPGLIIGMMVGSYLWNEPTLRKTKQIEQQLRAQFSMNNRYYQKLDECRSERMSFGKPGDAICKHQARMAVTSERELIDIIAYDAELNKKMTIANLRIVL